MITSEKIKELFLAQELFAQFRNNPDKLQVNILEEGTMDLHLDNFPGLNTNALNNRALGEFKVEDLDLSGGHVTSGGPDGIVVRYSYVEKLGNKAKPKF